jgi:hypothetical protein
LEAELLGSPEFWNSHARKVLLLGQDWLYKDKLLTRSILIDNSIHDYLGPACVRVHIRASRNPSDGPVRFEASHYSEELVISENTVRQAFARATGKSERLGRLAKVAERFIVSAYLTIW